MTDKPDEKTDDLRRGLRNVASTAKPPQRPRRMVIYDFYDDVEDAYAAAEAMGCGKYGFDE